MELLNQTLGRFQIVEKLGKGGMATVYKAYQTNLQRYVAIKVLSPALADDLDLVKRFLREARSAAALQHPNVIIIHDVDSEENVHYIVSEFLEGATLAQLMQQEGALSLQRIVHILRQVAQALDYAHSRGFIHRDIKPSNIMIDPARGDHVTLMDFGLVQVAGGSRITRAGYIMGTPDYMSPEQARGDPVDHRTDIYSLGVTTYHVLTGKVPFQKSTPHAVLLAHIMEDPPAMAPSGAGISPQLEAVVRKAMAKDPRDRYEWVGDMVDDLEMAINSPETFIAPSVVPSLYPQTPPPVAGDAPTVSAQAPLGDRKADLQAQRPGPPGFAPPQTPTPSPPAPGAPRHAPLGAPQFAPPQTPVPPQTPAPPQTVASRRRARWVWPVVGLVSVAVLAALVVAGILLWPRIAPMLNQPTATVVAAATLTPTVAPAIALFDVRPLEVTQGESVTIEWRATGVDAVTIQPNVRENAPPQGSIVHQPGQTTVYRLELASGATREVEVVVRPAPGAPVIESFVADPPTQVRGGEFRLAWRVSGDVTAIEISRGFEMIRGLSPEDEITLVADQTTTFLLNAYNGDLLSSAKIEFRVTEPTPTPTPTPEPTETRAPTETPLPPTPTPTATPLAPTPTQVSAPTRTPTPPPTLPVSGVVHAFETFGSWKRGDQPYGELSQSADQHQSGSYAARLDYDFGPASASDDFVVFANQVPVAGEPNAVQAWLYGDRSGHYVNIWIEDAQRQVWSVHMGALDFEGWRQVTGAIDPALPWPSGAVFGPDNGAIDYPVSFYGLVLDRPGAGPTSGRIYIDDIALLQLDQAALPEGTSTPSGPSGRIIFTVRLDEKLYALYATDPGWTKAVKIGDTDWGHSTCIPSATTAATLDGTVVALRPVERCEIAGTVGSCPSPDGKWKVNTNNLGSSFSVVLYNVAADRIEEAYYEGRLNIYVGLNWAPDSSHFLFTDESSVYRADVGRAGVYRVIPYKDTQWPLQYSADGSLVMYLKPVNGAIADVFVAQPDGSGERNLTNAPIAVKLCPRWRG
ncbi:MAG: serine/threonine protein kinase [Anaerolineae bacterium]|nr:serine/threonine protein kinase [Anaerolineae bacterium]